MKLGFKKMLRRKGSGSPTPPGSHHDQDALRQRNPESLSSHSFKTANEEEDDVASSGPPQLDREKVDETEAGVEAKDLVKNALPSTRSDDPLAGSSKTDQTSGTTTASKDSLHWDVPDSPREKEKLERPNAFSLSRLQNAENSASSVGTDSFYDDPSIRESYDAIPVIEQIKLPRGGISMETQAVGMIQFGIPPETIKDSMRLGLPVPSVYIVPVERFCREMGPALGVNLAEFEFPCYFNFFVNKKQCTLIVDSDDAERNIRRVFSETLLGPAQFRREEDPIAYEEEDFAPSFPRDAIPNFQKELKHFRIMPDGKELVLETLLKFCHFSNPGFGTVHDDLGIPPPLAVNGTSTETGEARVGGLESQEEIEEDEACEEVKVPDDLEAIEKRETTPWTYSQARWIGDVATVYPANASPQEIESRTVKRVEIFKMPGGTEYILHDIDENNYIVGKSRFSGNVKVSESMRVDGFGGLSILEDVQKGDGNRVHHDENDDDNYYDDDDLSFTLEVPKKRLAPPTFHPPSFGVTVLGNSHGFDKSGSVSGYVLWINGRGVMIDPPPYSSATLEREGIRPRTIVGIILTHCHADHDAGAFQKVLTGSQVAVITTPTIYKSFIRKYAALSALSPALLRHSHRHKPAIIGAPLRFQGATFHFTYSLHTIPCIGFRVEWRGRSMVFTGDHFNSPPAIDKLEKEGVLSKARADDLRNLPLQETDLLLHEAGAPPIHTPLDVLLQLPPRVKRRLYVVHTSSLPPDCELRVAPTGTAGTIRLDELQSKSKESGRHAFAQQKNAGRGSNQSHEDENVYSSSWASSMRNEYETVAEEDDDDDDDDIFDPVSMSTSFSHLRSPTPLKAARTSLMPHSSQTTQAPLVSLRPASSTDAWFILNLLSAVPFLTSLSYASTMEVLETAKVDAYCEGDVVVPCTRRNSVLCVIWEGMCMERPKDAPRLSSEKKSLYPISEERQREKSEDVSVWYAGDWTGPVALQPEKSLSGSGPLSSTHDIVAMSSEGVKVITVEFPNLHSILNSGSSLYRKYLERSAQQERVAAKISELENSSSPVFDEAIRNLSVLELIDCNSALRKLTAVQKRHLESLAEGPVCYNPGERLWRSGLPVDKAFIVVAGTASFLPKRRNAGSAGAMSRDRPGHISLSPKGHGKISVGESMRQDAVTAIRELSQSARFLLDSTAEESPLDSIEEETMKARKNIFQLDSIFSRSAGKGRLTSSVTDEANDYEQVSMGLQKRADYLNKAELSTCGSEYSEEPQDSLSELDFGSRSSDDDKRMALMRRRSSRMRFTNKVLGRLYNRRAFTSGFVFSRGHFLGDVSKMVAGILSSDDSSIWDDPEDFPKYGFGESEGMAGHARVESMSDWVISEHAGSEVAVHNSTLSAGKDGCVVLVFPKANLIPFLDEYPGLLLSLLGTQVVV